MRPSYLRLLWTLALAGFALDQASKYVVFTSLQSAAGHRRDVIPQTFELLAVLVRSDGYEPTAQLSECDAMSWTHPWGRWVEESRTAISVAVCMTIVVWGARRAAASDRKLCIALGLLLAGTLGNLYDRVLLGGVRDFLHCHLAAGGLVFNVADCCLFVGGGRILFYLVGGQPTGDVTSTDRSSVELLRDEPNKLAGAAGVIALDPRFGRSNVASV